MQNQNENYPMGQPTRPPGQYEGNLTNQPGHYPQPDPHTPLPPVNPAWQPAQAAPPTQQRRRGRGGALGLMALASLLILGVGLFAGWQFARSGSSTGTTIIPPVVGGSTEAVRESVIDKVRPGVVQINVRTAQGGGLGSGVIIDRRGYIVTNNHVIAGGQQLQVVLFDGDTLPGKIVGTAPSDDLAVVQINPPKNNLTVVPVGDSSKVRVGQDVLAIGNPLGITQTVTNGIVSAVDRNVSEGGNGGGTVLPSAIQTDAAINPGNSGGALVDLQGQLVGIPTLTAIDPEFKTPANGVGFAIPSNRVKFIVPQLINNGRVINTGRAALGIQGVSVDANVAAANNLPIDYGVLITSVTSGGAAAKAGLRPDDIIVQIDNQTISGLSSLSDALLSKKPGDTVTVQFYRGNQQQSTKATLGELPAR
jgi:S1-C subfamily serine protease